MKLNYEFGFLEKDCPLVSRELVRPWRLAALVAAFGAAIVGCIIFVPKLLSLVRKG